MRAARVVITAQTPAWARTAAQSLTGFATSVIGCKVEAGIEADLLPEETPDGRPGVSVPWLAAFHDQAESGQNHQNEADRHSESASDRLGRTHAHFRREDTQLPTETQDRPLDQIA